MNFCVFIIFVTTPTIATWNESKSQDDKLASLRRLRRHESVYFPEDNSCIGGPGGTCKTAEDTPSSAVDIEDGINVGADLYTLKNNKLHVDSQALLNKVNSTPYGDTVAYWVDFLRGNKEMKHGNSATQRRAAGDPTAASPLDMASGRITILATDAVESHQCTVPPRLNHGAYSVSNVPTAKPGDVFEAFELKLSCRRGYGFLESNGRTSGVLKIYCVKGLWSQAMPKCVRFCRLNPDPSVRYMCNTPGGGYRVCDQYVPPGTTVNPVCNSPIYYSAESLTYMECIGGFWNYIAKCKAECGRVTPIGEQLLLGGDRAKRGELPWHAGIFTKTTQPYMQICGGSLVANTVVISAAHCFWHDVHNQLPASRFAVAVGKLYRPWDNIQDVDAQKSDVKEIKLPTLFSGSSTNFQEDIALLIMATPFIYKTFVRPICLNFDTNFDRRQLQPGKIGKVAGWGLQAPNGKPSQVLQVIEIPYISLKTCLEAVPLSFREYITGDKFCAGYTNGTGVCRGDSGGGLSFPAQTELDIERYFLRGVVSAAPDSEDLCNSMTYTAFTRMIKHEDLIKQVMTSADKTCPPYLFQCDDGSCLYQGADCDGRQDCEDGSDEAEDLCTAELAVATVTPDSLPSNSQCVFPTSIENGSYQVINQKASSGEFVPVQQISVTCNKDYNPVRSEGKAIDSTSPVISCVNGKWDKSIPKCVSTINLECGKVFPGNQPLSLGDRAVQPGELPWHASIYSKRKTPYDHICGGNIISENLILTAAHCFKMGVDPKSYAIATGNIYAPWDSDLDSNNAVQKLDVLRINIASTYKGEKSHDFNADLAVVEITSSLNFTNYVKPICLNFDSKFNKIYLDAGKLMRVAAWSLSLKDRKLDSLQAVDMTYVELKSCNETIAENIQGHISEDKICAGYAKDRSGFRSLAGSGVVVPQSLDGVERYFLQGLTSYVVTCRSCVNSIDAYYMFTSVTGNKEFIKRFI